MGGVFGHMSHLHDNPNLKFSQIKDIFQKASAGELVGTEKTDGQNLFVSYDIRDGVVRAARNKGNIKDGGLTPEGLADKFAGRGALSETFVDAFDAFALAVSRMPEELQLRLFGPEANIYYNAEVQDPRSANLINYDVKTLNIHRTGHAEYDKETGNPLRDANENAGILEKYLLSAENTLENTEYRVQVNAVRALEKLESDAALHEALARLEGFTSKYGLSDDNTVGEYLVRRLDIRVTETFPDISLDTKKLLMKRMFEEGYGVEEDEETGKKKKKTTLKSILSSLENPDLSSQIRRAISNSKVVISEFVFPLEDIIHDFAVEMLKGLESAFVLDSGAEVERQRKEVRAAIEAIEASGNEEAMEILKKQMKKLKKIENISTATEGFVFDYDGNTYKFTGNFAPMNQLLGLFKYGRGSVPPLKAIEATDILTEAFVNKGDSFMFIPGGFKPPHKGHLHLLKTAVQNIPDAKPYVVTGETPRDGIGLDQAMQIWKVYIQNEPELAGMDELSFITVPKGGLPVLSKEGHPLKNKAGQMRRSNSPLQAIYNSAMGLPKNSSLYIVSSAADESHALIGDSIMNARPDLKVRAFAVKTLDDPVTGGKFSASEVRKAISDGDLERFKQFLPDNEAVQRRAEYIFKNILKTKPTTTEKPEKPPHPEDEPMAECFRAGNFLRLVEVIMDSSPAKKERERTLPLSQNEFDEAEVDHWIKQVTAQQSLPRPSEPPPPINPVDTPEIINRPHDYRNPMTSTARVASDFGVRLDPFTKEPSTHRAVDTSPRSIDTPEADDEARRLDRMTADAQRMQDANLAMHMGPGKPPEEVKFDREVELPNVRREFKAPVNMQVLAVRHSKDAGNHVIFRWRDEDGQSHRGMAMHLDKLPEIEPGRIYKSGDHLPIKIGNTGRSTGDHLHMEARPETEKEVERLRQTGITGKERFGWKGRNVSYNKMLKRKQVEAELEDRFGTGKEWRRTLKQIGTPEEPDPYDRYGPYPVRENEDFNVGLLEVPLTEIEMYDKRVGRVSSGKEIMSRSFDDWTNWIGGKGVFPLSNLEGTRDWKPGKATKLKKKEGLEEMSGMAGGAVQGYSAPLGRSEDDDEDGKEEQSLIREKEALVEEILNYLL